MSIFGFYFVSNLLRKAGWPRKQGVFGKSFIDTTVLDSAVDQMIEWAAAIGAGRPTLALRVIAEIYRDRDWSGAEAPNIKSLINSARKENELWCENNVTSPREVVNPPRFAKASSRIKSQELSEGSNSTALEQLFVEGLLWGFANPKAFSSYYHTLSTKHQERLDYLKDTNLEIELPLQLDDFYSQSEQILINYEHEVHSLPRIPEELSVQAHSLGRAV